MRSNDAEELAIAEAAQMRAAFNPTKDEYRWPPGRPFIADILGDGMQQDRAVCWVDDEKKTFGTERLMSIAHQFEPKRIEEGWAETRHDALFPSGRNYAP